MCVVMVQAAGVQLALGRACFLKAAAAVQVEQLHQPHGMHAGKMLLAVGTC